MRSRALEEWIAFARFNPGRAIARIDDLTEMCRRDQAEYGERVMPPSVVQNVLARTAHRELAGPCKKEERGGVDRSDCPPVP